MIPSQSQIEVARRLVEKRSPKEIEERMKKLEKIHKGAGWPMYESFKMILLERKTEVTRK
jgi:hypothetical protein